jgi:hypothetical protein
MITMQWLRSLGICLLLLPLAPVRARADELDLGPLERDAVDTALAARGLVIDPAPEGKVIGAIQVMNLEVFQPNDGGILVWFNHFHRTTREGHVRRESLLQPGMAYELLLVKETLRGLRNRTTYAVNDPPTISIVAMVPIQSQAPGTVDLLIVTRDVWSLRFNSDYNLDVLSLDVPTLNASLSENNLLGWRKQVALVFKMSQGDMWFGPNYLDPNMLGSRLRLTAAFYSIWARRPGKLAAGPHEGNASLLRLEYPLYALSQRWGGFVQGSYTTRVERAISNNADYPTPTLKRYLPSSGNGPSQCILPSNVAGNPFSTLSADCDWRVRNAGVTSGLTHSFRRDLLVQRITAGLEFSLNRLSFLPDFPTDPDLRGRFAAQFFGISERKSWLYLQYDTFTPRYRTYRNLDSFDLGEDLRLGPWLTLKVARASTLLGSEKDFFFLRAEAHVNLALAEGFQSIGASWEGRVSGDGWQDELITGNITAATPVLAHSIRVIAQGIVSLVANNQHRSRTYVGGLEGLRGYPVNLFYGYNYYLAHLELRSMAFSLTSLRVGGVVFADAGDAQDLIMGDASTGLPGLGFYSNVGVGLRVLIPQLNADVLRCDWGIPLRSYLQNGNVVYPAGLPGRVYCGFRQAF